MAIDEIYILHHTHVDVGYTDLQPVIYDQHVQYISQALDYCRQTDGYPDDARFRWISEFSWPVMLFLQRCPQRAEELFSRLRDRRFELCGLYLDPTELQDRRSFEVSLQPALKLAREQDFPLSTVMTTDIPGQGWSLADVIVEQGLSYLSVSPNAMVSKPVQVERPFYWVGPRGSKVLVWRTDWRLGWYGEGHVLGFPQGLAVMRRKVREYLDLLVGEGYPWHILALHMGADNYPPSAALPDLVRTWNEQEDLPRLRLATNQEFFQRLLQLHGEQFPSYQLAWPDWWSEGLGSAAFETALSRQTHARLQRIEALQQHLGETGDLWPIWEELLLFDEHTWGCQSMALRPHALQSRATWAFKSVHAYLAFDRARRVEEDLVASLSAPPETSQAEDFRDATVQEAGPGAQTITLFNPLAAAYHGPVALPQLATEIGELKSAATTAPVQRTAATPLAPATSWVVVSAPAGKSQTWSGRVKPTSPLPAPNHAEKVLESDWYRLCFDGAGRILSLQDLTADRELLDTRAPWGFAETIHESITGTQDRDAVWEKGYRAIPYGRRRTDAPFRREGALAGGELLAVERGPVFSAITWRGSLPYVRKLETTIKLWQALKRIEVEVRLDKQACETYESLYVAFPFNLDDPRALLHSCDAVFEAEAQQMPGSCRDYYAIQDFAAFESDEGWVVMTPVESPLVQLGEITFGRWADHLQLQRACFYAWLTNNFWYTNFPGFQQGDLHFRFAFTTGSGRLDTEAARSFGRQVRVGVSMR